MTPRFKNTPFGGGGWVVLSGTDLEPESEPEPGPETELEAELEASWFLPLDWAWQWVELHRQLSFPL